LAMCAACGAENDLSSLPLESLVALGAVAAQPLMTPLVFEALQSRWRSGQLGLQEAADIVDEINRADGWNPSETEVLPFEPPMACEIVQYAILGSPTAIVEKGDDRYSLYYLLKSSGGVTGMMSEIAFQGAVAVSAPRAPLPGAEILAMRSRSRKGESDNLVADPAIIVQFENLGGESSFSILVRDAMDNVAPASEPLRSKWYQMILKEFRMAACRYITFRAMLGGWATGAMLYGSTEKALEVRLTQLGGTLKARASELSEALLPKTMKK
jgi:hypothetical protein